MKVDTVRLTSFRNYVSQEIAFEADTNVIVGANAQGKTNLLEAIEYLTSGRSFRTRYDRELISFGAGEARIQADFTAEDRAQTLDIRIGDGRRKEIYRNGVRLKTAAELSGSLTSVLFCPGDLNIVREGAALRRRFMDTCLCQLRPGYAAALSDFNRALQGKTRILRDGREKPSLYELLDEYDQRMALMTAHIVRYRQAFIARLSEIAAGIHSQFSAGAETLGLEYTTIRDIPDATAPAEENAGIILDHISRHRQAEIASGQCLCGAHKDDIEITINGSSARSFASQGQARTAALSMKLAEREIHFAALGEYPLLLLDDVLSELDETRQSFVLNRIGGGQTFITCCADTGIASRTGGKVITIEGGRRVG